MRVHERTRARRENCSAPAKQEEEGNATAIGQDERVLQPLEYSGERPCEERERERERGRRWALGEPCGYDSSSGMWNVEANMASSERCVATVS